MPIRSLNLPEDFQTCMDIVKDAFHYPDHPEWEPPPEQEQNYADPIRFFERWWFLFRMLSVFSPRAMDRYRGYIWEEDNCPVGVVTCGHVGAGRWEIGFLAVLPQYRGRGIAKQLLQSVLDFIRQRDGKIATLSVLKGNLPACKLYEQRGFVQYATRTSFHYPVSSSFPATDVILPTECRLEPRSFFDHKSTYELDRRITPDIVARYQPVEPDCYQTPLPQKLFFFWMGKLLGLLVKDVLIYCNKDVVACGGYEARTRPGGINHIYVRADPSCSSYPEIVGYLMTYLLGSVQKDSPGREIRFTLLNWQEGEIEAALASGCEATGSQYLCLGLEL